MIAPLIVVEGSEAALGHALREVKDAGWEIVGGWRVPAASERIVCTGTIASNEDAAAALLAVVAGAGVVAFGCADRDVLDRLCDDLRRLGRLDHRPSSTPLPPSLTSDERALAEHLLDGLTLGEAARRVNISRRTADRRLASIRRTLGVETTAEALARLARHRF